MTTAVICPDAVSVLLFCPGIIHVLRQHGTARVIVLTEVGQYRAELEALGVDAFDVPISRFVDPIADAKYTWRLFRALRRERCEAVLNFSTKPNIYGSMAAWLAGVSRVVSFVSGRGVSFLPDSSLRGRVLRGTMRVLYSIACALSDRVWFTNRHDAEYFTDRQLIKPERVLLTRMYLDTEYYSPARVPAGVVAEAREELAVRPGEIIVLMIARLIWPKGLREFADAARMLHARRPEIRCVLVASVEPPGPQTVPEEFLREREREGSLRWLGFHRDLRGLYTLCDIAVLSSYYREGGYPRALLEPMAMGKPLITTTSEDCRGAVDEGRNGLLVPPRDAEALAKAIEQLADDPAMRTRYGAWSREKAQREFEEARIVGEALIDAGMVASA